MAEKPKSLSEFAAAHMGVKKAARYSDVRKKKNP